MIDYLKFWLGSKGKKGQDLAEYALLIGLIALVVVVSVTLLGTQISSVFSNLSSRFAAAPFQ